MLTVQHLLSKQSRRADLESGGAYSIVSIIILHSRVQGDLTCWTMGVSIFSVMISSSDFVVVSVVGIDDPLKNRNSPAILSF